MNTMAYKGYSTAVEYDSRDNILVGRLMGIQDIVVFHGETVAKFEKMFHESVDGYIESCAHFGKDPENPASGRLMLRVPPAVHCAALAASRASGESLNQWATKALASAAGV